MEGLRIDKWLWAARFYKTRSLATEEVAKGRVQLNEQDVKPAREVRIGDTIGLRQGAVQRVVIVRALSGVRGSATIAQALYEETPESIAAREHAAQQRRFGVEPAHTLQQGRPTKRDRREIKGWNDRWSASLDDPDASR